jgi:16S rRNA processing protein RimM
MTEERAPGTQSPPTRTVEVGVVARPHGIRGEIRVHLHNPSSDALARVREVVLAGPGEERRIGCLATGRSKEGALLRLEGIDDRDAADALRGARVLVDRDALEPLEEGQYLYTDLVGCRVVEESGEELGVVGSVFEAGASDVLVVRKSGAERLIPLVAEYVRSVELEARVIRTEGANVFEPQEEAAPRAPRGRRGRPVGSDA